MTVDQLLASLTEKEIKEIKDNAIEIDVAYGEHLSEVVIRLERLRRQGKINYFANFNDERLYSLDVTMDKAYRQCIGESRRSFLKSQKDWYEKCKKELEESEKRALELLPTWIEEGKKYIRPEKINQWAKDCERYAKGDYHGLTIQDSLELIQMLEEGKPFDEVKNKLDEQRHSGMSESITLITVLDYSSKGPQFYSYIYGKDMIDNQKDYVRKAIQLNKMLDEGIGYDESVKILRDFDIMSVRIGIETFFNIDYFDGFIMVNKDSTFEGFLENGYYLKGKIMGNEISFADFTNQKCSSHYCGTGDGTIFTGKKETDYDLVNRSLEGVITIEVRPTNFSLEKDSQIIAEIYEVRNSLNDDTMDEVEYFTEYFEDITDDAMIEYRKPLILKPNNNDKGANPQEV